MVEAGCDEAGRGPLAGSVFAAAVILDPERVNQVPEFAWLKRVLEEYCGECLGKGRIFSATERKTDGYY